MVIGGLRIPSLGEFRKDTRLILISSGIFSVGFFGVQTLLKVLYILRLGYGLEYIGIFTATSALTYMAMSLPSGALGNRFGLKPAMVLGGVLTTAGMVMLPHGRDHAGLGARFVADPVADGADRRLGHVQHQHGAGADGRDHEPHARRRLRVERHVARRRDLFRHHGGRSVAHDVRGGAGQSIDGPAPYRWALLVGAAFGVAGMIPLLRVNVEEAQDVAVETEAHGAFPLALVAVASLHVILINGSFAACQSFCSAYMDTDLNLSTAAIGFLTAIGQFLAILAPVAMPYLGVRRSHAWTLMVVGGLTAVMLVPLALIPTWQVAGVSRMGLLALSALWMPALQVFQMTVIERHWRSLAYGTVSTAMGFAYGTVSLVGGFIAASMGYSIAVRARRRDGRGRRDHHVGAPAQAEANDVRNGGRNARV